MKKIINIILLFITFILPPVVRADMFMRAELSGMPVITPSNITANINLTYPQIGISRLWASALEPFITNNENPNIKIPVNKLFLICDGESYQLSNTGMQLFYIDPLGDIDFTRTAQKNITLRLENIGELPAGTYSVPLKFVNRTSIVQEYECDFLFTFIIEEKQTLSSFSGDPYIVLSEEDVFNKQISVKNKNDIRLDLTSNTGWNLWLDTSGITNIEGEYSFLIKSYTGNISSYEQNLTQILPNKRYLLARGTSTLEGFESGNTIPTSLTIEYSFKNNSDRFIKEGIQQYPLTYIMERE